MRMSNTRGMQLNTVVNFFLSTFFFVYPLSINQAVDFLFPIGSYVMGMLVELVEPFDFVMLYGLFRFIINLVGIFIN